MFYSRKNNTRILIAMLIFACFSCALSSAQEEYIIGHGDMLEINVWENPDLSSRVPVRPDGKISLPLLDDIQAAGLTPLQLKEVISKRLESYIQAPRVTVVVTSINSFTVSAQGEVVNRGEYSFTKKVTLLDLMTRNGGPTPEADLRSAFVLRDNIKLPVDLYLLWVKKDLSQNLELQPGDTLIVPNNYGSRITLVGELRNPQAISYREGMTIVDAILQSGGLTEFANGDDVTVIRKIADEELKLNVNLNEIIKKGKVGKNILLMPGDTIVVKESWF